MDTAENKNESKLDSILPMISKDWKFATSLIGLSIPLIFFPDSRDIGILLFLFSLLAYFLYFFNADLRKKQFSYLEHVTNLPDESEFHIKRDELAKEIAEMIIAPNEKNPESYENGKESTSDQKNSTDYFHVIVGTSGSGKSVLFEKCVPDFYNEFLPEKVASQQVIVRSYDNIEKEIREELDKSGILGVRKYNLSEVISRVPENKRLIIVFDQFESVFLLEEKLAIRQLQILCKFFKSCEKDNLPIKKIDCVIVMRHEWFFNLKFFQEYMPHIKNVKVLVGFDSEDKELREKIIEALRKLTKEDELTEAILADNKHSRKNEMFFTTFCKNSAVTVDERNAGDKNILPVELLTVAESFNILKRINGDKKIGGNYDNKKKAIRRYFEYYLNSYEDKEDARQVLYALCVSPKGRRTLSIDEVSRITNIPVERVKPVIAHFLGQRKWDDKTTKKIMKIKPHLIQIDETVYDWKHDFFADQFNEISGNMLDPIDRDNINFFWHNREKLIKDRPLDEASEKDYNEKYEILGTGLLISAFLLLVARTFLPFLVKIIPFLDGSDFFSVSLFNVKPFGAFTNIDISFLPIAISLTLWSWYVTTLYRRLLSVLEEQKGSFARGYSTFVAWWSLICVVLTVMLPLLWVFFTGIGGLIVGIKYQQMTKFDKSVTASFNESFMKRLYQETKINSLVMIFVGFAYSLLFPPFTRFGIIQDNPAWLQYWMTGAFFIIMVYFANLSITEHTSMKKIPTYLGIYNRYRS